MKRKQRPQATDHRLQAQRQPPSLDERYGQVLFDAHAQVISGKGAERHGRGRALDEQPIWRLLDLYGPGFAAGQAAKKAEEALGFMQVGPGGAYAVPHPDREKAIEAELLGAINYLAMLVAWRRAKA